MTIPAQPVTTYYRFSTREQAEGTSIRRQQGDCKRFADDRGWTVAVELVDEGKSAFSGKNREIGSALGRYEEEVRLGLHHDTIFLVERLDRVSRQGYDETSDFVKLLTRHGVTVATVDGSEIYPAGQRLDTFAVIKLLLKAELAHEESAKKAQRLRARYELDRVAARASGKAMTKNLPGWLRIGRDGKPEVVPGRDVVVQRIYDLADAGKGSLKIVQAINAEFEPWEGLNGQRAGQWNRSRITRILQDRQVTGEYQPRSMVNGKSEPNGEPWPGYFPTVVSVEQFERVNAAATVRQSPVNRRSRVQANLFAGMLRCRDCGSWMLFETKRVAGSTYHGGRYTMKHDEASLRCSQNHFGGACGNRATVSYYGFERAMLDACLHLALDDRTFARRDDLAKIMGEVAERRRAQEVAMTSAVALWEGYAAAQSPMAMKLAQDAEARAATLAIEVEALERRAEDAAGKADAEAHLSRIAEFRRHLYADDVEARAEHRTKVGQGFRTIVERIDFDQDRVAHVRFVAGSRVMTIKRGKIVMNFDLNKPGKVSAYPAVRAMVRRTAQVA